MNLDRIARQADHALDVVRGIGGEGRLEDDDLLAFWIAPEGDMQIGEGHTGVVSDAAHDEVVADEQRVLHGAGGNHASLADGAVDEEECESDPEPGDNLALNSGLDGQMRLGWRRLLLHFGFGVLFGFHDFFSSHVPPLRDDQSRRRWRRRKFCPGWSTGRSCRLPAPRAARGQSGNFQCSRRCRNRRGYRCRPGARRKERYSPGKRRRENCGFPPAYATRRSTLREWACPRRSSRG